MAFTLTTLSAAVLVNDTTIMLTAVTGIAQGSLIAVDKEIMKVAGAGPFAATTPVLVQRGQEGTANQAHASGAQVKIGSTVSTAGSPDWTGNSPGAPSIALLPGAWNREVISYSASGAIQLPRVGSDMVAILNGTTVRAMTLENPSIAHDGHRLTIVGNGKAAHTVTYTAGLGNVGAAADVITFKADQSQAIALVACGGFWVNESLVAGAATVAGAGLA